MNVLELNNVVKTYQNHIAVNDVSFNVPKGSIFGLLGPNGAGKTSLIRIITTITRQDSGSVLLDGEKLNSRHPSEIGYMPEERGLYKKMKVGEHLLYLAQLKGLSKANAKREINHWLEKFEITDWWNKKIEELSKGMQQKIQFIATVVHQPKLLILDEPFSGLDPINTNLIKDEISELNRKGTSIIFSTHRMEQVEQICQEIVLINQGRNVLQGDVHTIKQNFKNNLFEINYSGMLPESLQAEDDANEDYSIIKNENNRLTIKVSHDSASNSLLNYLMKNGVYINGFNEILPSLNEIFIRQVEEGKLAVGSLSRELGD
jgi:ABC-2 type transport system ATP-binding protein